MYKEKLQKWQEKNKMGKGEIEILNFQSSGWLYVKGKRVVNIHTVYACVCEEMDVLYETEWSMDNLSNNPNTQKKAIVIKNRKKIIFEGEEEKNTWGFGFGEIEKNQRMLLYFRCEDVAILLWAWSKDLSVSEAIIEKWENAEELDGIIKIFKTRCVEKGDVIYE